MTNKRPKPIVLTVLDGWGYRAETAGNAIALARKPNYDRLLAEFPNTLIHTSGPSVGLPEGQMGNSEVGHMNMGAGRVVQMDITRIDQAIATGALFHNDLLLERHAARARTTTAPAGPAERRRRALAHRASVCPAAHGAAKQGRARLRPLLPRRPRHATEQRHRLPAPAPAENARARRRPHRLAHRPLLRHGPRQPLGARRARLSRRRARRSRSAPRPIRSRPCATATNRASRTNSSCRWSITAGARPRRRPGRHASATTTPSSSSTSAPTARAR